MRLLFILAVCIGIVLLQIFLSKKKNKWLGLILPIICIIFSVIFSVGGTPDFTKGELTLSEFDTNGNIVTEEVIEEHRQPLINNGSTIITIILTLLVYNIPTPILLAIYFGCREKIKKNNQLDKMNIQDLE